jgi:hypothetical protein
MKKIIIFLIILFSVSVYSQEIKAVDSIKTSISKDTDRLSITDFNLKIEQRKDVNTTFIKQKDIIKTTFKFIYNGSDECFTIPNASIRYDYDYSNNSGIITEIGKRPFLLLESGALFTGFDKNYKHYYKDNILCYNLSNLKTGDLVFIDPTTAFNNSGFETGDLTGWSITIVNSTSGCSRPQPSYSVQSSSVISGSYSFKTTGYYCDSDYPSTPGDYYASYVILKNNKNITNGDNVSVKIAYTLKTNFNYVPVYLSLGSSYQIWSPSPPLFPSFVMLNVTNGVSNTTYASISASTYYNATSTSANLTYIVDDLSINGILGTTTTTTTTTTLLPSISNIAPANNTHYVPISSNVNFTVENGTAATYNATLYARIGNGSYTISCAWLGINGTNNLSCDFVFLGDLEYSTEYNFYLVANDSNGNTTTGSYYFRTMDENYYNPCDCFGCCAENMSVIHSLILTSTSYNSCSVNISGLPEYCPFGPFSCSQSRWNITVIETVNPNSGGGISEYWLNDTLYSGTSYFYNLSWSPFLIDCNSTVSCFYVLYFWGDYLILNSTNNITLASITPCGYNATSTTTSSTSTTFTTTPATTSSTSTTETPGTTIIVIVSTEPSTTLGGISYGNTSYTNGSYSGSTIPALNAGTIPQGPGGLGNTSGLGSSTLGLPNADLLKLIALVIITLATLFMAKFSAKLALAFGVGAADFMSLVMAWITFPASLLLLAHVIMLFQFFIQKRKDERLTNV